MKATTLVTGITNPKEVQKMVDDAQSEIDRSHRRNIAAIDKLKAPLQHYVDRDDFVARLAKKTEECFTPLLDPGPL